MFVITKDDKPAKWQAYIPGERVPEKKPAGPRTRICGQCGGEFKPRKKVQQFCSRRCSSQGQFRHRKGGTVGIEYGKNAAQSRI